MHVVPKLKLPVKANVYEIQRVRLLNRQPVSYELTYLPEHIGLKRLTTCYNNLSK